MGDLIDIERKRRDPTARSVGVGPWEFRRASWQTPHFIQMLRLHADGMDPRVGRPHIPPHFALSGSMGWTIRGLYASRENETKMRELYYLAGLIDCLINQSNPILRTHLIRDLYKRVFALKKGLNVRWYGPMEQVLLPIDGCFYNESSYRLALRRAKSLKEIYRTIRCATRRMFDILSLEYVFFCPNLGGWS